VLFQSLDDKSECVGVYCDGKIYYDNFPSDLTHTWKYTPSHTDESVQYASLYCETKSLQDVCPDELKDELSRAQKRFKAYIKSFQLAKISMRDHCIFDLVPADFLKQFCEIKNKITHYVFETYKKPSNYEHLVNVQRLLHQIKYQPLNLNNEGCKNLHYSVHNSTRVKRILHGSRYIDYNLFGTVTGRLTTYPESFPILTLQKEFRKLLKPTNDWLLSLDYNAAEVRTFIALAGEEQPKEDVHEWHIKNLIEDELTREDAKVRFFAWLYNYDSNDDEFGSYHRERLLADWYDGTAINTPFDRKIIVDKRKALNYLIQSTTSDIVLERAVAIDNFLKDKESFVAFVVHDEIVIDLKDSEKELVPEIKEMFSKNKLDEYLVNLSCGKNYYELQELSL